MKRTAEESEFADILPWDSEQFGFPVARIVRASSPPALVRVAGSLRARGVRLAYFNAPTSRPAISPETLAAVGGRLVDIRVTYARKLSETESHASRGQPVLPNAGLELGEFVSDRATPELVELSRAAGRYSRFRTDPGIDALVFARIYDAWIERSVKREIADDVVVARQSGAIVGLITWKAERGFSQIGLFAVDAEARGRGVGRGLLDVATARMSAYGSREARVATQSANVAACRLYEAAGFSVATAERCYHLWLL